MYLSKGFFYAIACFVWYVVLVEECNTSTIISCVVTHFTHNAPIILLRVLSELYNYIL